MTTLTQEEVLVSKMSADDRLLYENGLINSDCSPTTAGWDFMKRTVFDNNKADLVKLVKSVAESKVEA